ncbi:NUDIX domain-containing protein [Asticcacaulis sp. W401b]|uniref:NUDIX domain-containing protein n=1 Tax=Asticcacaulis sp. W401b TaxID=3388666 RepID=UPI0039709017
MNIVLVCRFQPFVLSHLNILKSASATSERLVVVVVGMEERREARYPWTAFEQALFVEKALEGQQAEIVRVGEYGADQDLLLTLKPSLGEPELWRWGVIEDDFDPEALGLPIWSVPDTRSETRRVRDEIFEGKSPGSVATASAVDQLRGLPQWEDLVAENRMIKKYMQSWEAAPYPVNLVTADSVLYRDGAILLIQRALIPGKGLWALPGGFVEPNESLLAASIREVSEETGLRLPLHVLKGRLLGTQVFDRPNRCSRGRTITHGFIYDLSGVDLPPLMAGDDAGDAIWVPVAALVEWQEVFFQDHYHIALSLLRQAGLV